MKKPVRRHLKPARAILGVSTFLILLSGFCGCIKEDTSANLDQTKYFEPIQPPLGKDVVNGTIIYLDFPSFSNNVGIHVKDNDNDSVYVIDFWYNTTEYAHIKIDTTSLINDNTSFSGAAPGDSQYVVLRNVNTINFMIDILPTDSIIYSLGVKRINAHLTPQTEVYYGLYHSWEFADMMRTDTSSRKAAIKTIEGHLYESLGYDDYYKRNYASGKFYMKRHW